MKKNILQRLTDNKEIIYNKNERKSNEACYSCKRPRKGPALALFNLFKLSNLNFFSNKKLAKHNNLNFSNFLKNPYSNFKKCDNFGNLSYLIKVKKISRFRKPIIINKSTKFSNSILYRSFPKRINISNISDFYKQDISPWE